MARILLSLNIALYYKWDIWMTLVNHMTAVPIFSACMVMLVNHMYTYIYSKQTLRSFPFICICICSPVEYSVGMSIKIILHEKSLAYTCIYDSTRCTRCMYYLEDNSNYWRHCFVVLQLNYFFYSRGVRHCGSKIERWS